jgi:hypothetical protein
MCDRNYITIRKELRRLKKEIDGISHIYQMILDYQYEAEMFPEDFVPDYDDSEIEMFPEENFILDYANSENERRWR